MATESQSLPSASSGALKMHSGLSTLFNQSMRRSRSMANLQKAAPESLKSNSSLSVHQEEPEPAKQKPIIKKPVPEPEPRLLTKRKILTPTASSSSVFTINHRSKDGGRTPSPPARPAPAPRLWDDDELTESRQQTTPPRVQNKSLRGLETSVAPRNGSPSIGTMSPRGTSPRSRASPRIPRDRSLAHRRKHSVTELAIEPMSTVQESFESPYMPGAPRRSMSAKETVRNSLTPKAMESEMSLDDFTDDLTKTPTSKSIKSYRRSSMLLPGTLAPLLIPNSPLEPVPPPVDPDTIFLPATTFGMKSPPPPAPVELAASPVTKLPTPQEEAEDTPPPLPPKSPRHVKKAFTTPRPMPPPQSASFPPPRVQSKPSHTANSSVSSSNKSASPTSTSASASHTVSTSISSSSPLELPGDSQQLPTKEENSPPAKSESSSAPPALISPLPFSPTRPEVSSPRRPLHNQNNFSIDETVSKSPLERSHSARHQRNISDSMINRGRPMRRGEADSKRTLSRQIKLAAIDGTINQLPGGWGRTSVFNALTTVELNKLRQDAESQASTYETLPCQSVEDLSKELALLDDHCLTLRRTVVSLRESRKTLHERMIAFLKAPGNALVSRDHVVKQETSLSELDANIDEWTTKLETTQERRTKVQRKLLEHVSAVLSLHLPPASVQGEEHTPPRSPVSEDDAEQLERLSYTLQVQQLQEQRKRESEERRQRLRLIEQLEREQEELQEERRIRKESDATVRDSLLMVQSPASSPRTSTQTIQVYADEEVTAEEDNSVASLLASIEQEIDAMDRMRHS